MSSVNAYSTSGTGVFRVSPHPHRLPVVFTYLLACQLKTMTTHNSFTTLRHKTRSYLRFLHCKNHSGPTITFSSVSRQLGPNLQRLCFWQCTIVGRHPYYKETNVQSFFPVTTTLSTSSTLTPLYSCTHILLSGKPVIKFNLPFGDIKKNIHQLTVPL